ncbi:hypothetical protein U9M48_001630 [Paspalum notatum var. saurae]|uniref:Protein kinase domain-containing protein n=1 Tax=Paspalum notatum var. saurae TaxID=547442 RepID=A0AAQ3SGV4_PASNO
MVQAVWLLLATTTLAISPLIMTPVAAATGSANSTAAPPPAPMQAGPEPGCLRKCGEVDVPYPFGIGNDNDTCCSWRGNFILTCNNTFDPPRLYSGNVQIFSISLEAGEMRVASPVSSFCYNSSTTLASDVSSSLNVTPTPFLVSRTRNILVAVGCSIMAFLEAGGGGGDGDVSYLNGCISYFAGLHEAAQDGDECTGLGCCQTSIPGNLSYIKVSSHMNNTDPLQNPLWESCRCGYAFVSEKDRYRFSRQDLTGVGKYSSVSRFGVGLTQMSRWCLTGPSGAVGLVRRTVLHRQLWPVSAPTANVPTLHKGLGIYVIAPRATRATPTSVTDAKGRFIELLTVHIFPYFYADINECELPKTNDSSYRCGSATTCHDTEGSYMCKCKFLHRGDGKSEKGCQPIIPGYAFAIVASFVAFALACVAMREIKRRGKRKYFDKNGGELLKGVGIVIFKERQLSKITNGYKNSIGKGAYGEVYKGTLDGGRQVAVKRPLAQGRAEIGKEEFVKEITFQFKISHANVVRLVGCCLETGVPILVFEFVPNGSLWDVLHGAKGARVVLSLPQRLDIAIGSAEALSYMHSHAEHHVHGDVKSANILLDDNLMPKVSDFGSSKLLRMGMYSRSVVADMSYLDPVYMKTGRFTEKSDVYSFGVMLVELITRKTAKYDGDKSLPIEFIKSWKGGGGEVSNKRVMYDTAILSSAGGGVAGRQSQVCVECVDMVGELAVRCLMEDVDERPTMAEVLEELKRVKRCADGVATM